MPQRRSSSDYVFNNRTILAQDSDVSGAWVECCLSLKFNPSRSRAMIGLRLRADFEEYDTTQDVLLQLSPDVVQRIGVGLDSEQIPQSVTRYFRRNTALSDVDNIIVLSLDTSAPGRLIVPQDATILTPITAYQSRVQNFQRICRATQLQLYIPTTSPSSLPQQTLVNFANRIRTGDLAPIHTDLRRFQRGQGGREAATCDIFHFSEAPPTYEQQQAERPTGNGKRSREGSPAGTPPKRLAGEAQTGGARPHVVCNSDSETDFSHLALSPVSGLTQQPAAAAANIPTTSRREEMREALRAELATTLPVVLSEMLLGMVRDMLPQMVHDMLPSALLRDLPPSNGGSPDATRNSATPADSPSSTIPSPSLIARIVEPLVAARLPEAVQNYIELEDPLENYVYGAEQTITEAAEDAEVALNMLKDQSISEIEEAGESVVQRLAGVDWNAVGKEIMGLTPSQDSDGGGAAAEATVPLGPGLGSEPKTQQTTGGSEVGERGGVDDGMEVPNAQRDEETPSPSQASTVAGTEGSIAGKAPGRAVSQRVSDDDLEADRGPPQLPPQCKPASNPKSANSSPGVQSRVSSESFRWPKISPGARPGTRSGPAMMDEVQAVSEGEVGTIRLDSDQYATAVSDKSELSNFSPPGSKGKQ